MTPKELMESVEYKLELLLKDKDDLKKIIFGENGKGGMNQDLIDIKKAIIGDPEYKKEGLIEKVNRLDETYKKFQHMGTFAMAMIGVGGAVGSLITWFVHKADKIKAVFFTITNH